jgi:hypothetical protein
MVARGPVVAPGRFGPVVGPGRVAGRTVVANNRVRFTSVPPFAFGFGRCFGFHCRNPFFFNNAFFNPFLFGGFGWGGWWPYSYIPGFDYGYNQQPQQQPVAVSEGTNANDVQLLLEMQRLGDQVESLREEQRRQASAAQAPPGPAPATTFVFRDGRRLSTQSYAISGQTVWILSEHTARKVPMTELDLAATEQANAANGVEIRLPEQSR